VQLGALEQSTTLAEVAICEKFRNRGEERELMNEVAGSIERDALAVATVHNYSHSAAYKMDETYIIHGLIRLVDVSNLECSSQGAVQSLQKVSGRFQSYRYFCRRCC
jgi:hypothetical protein